MYVNTRNTTDFIFWSSKHLELMAVRLTVIQCLSPSLSLFFFSLNRGLLNEGTLSWLIFIKYCPNVLYQYLMYILYVCIWYFYLTISFPKIRKPRFYLHIIFSNNFRITTFFRKQSLNTKIVPAPSTKHSLRFTNVFQRSANKIPIYG